MSRLDPAVPDAVSAAWLQSDHTRVVAALDAWREKTDTPSLEYWLQRVYADSVFERPTLDVSVREAERMARAAGDQVALARIGASVVDALYSDWRPSREARRWLDALRNVAFARLATLDPQPRLEIAAGILAADLFGESLASAARVADAVLPWVGDANAVSATVRGNALGYAAGGNSLDNTIRIVNLAPTDWVLCDIGIHGIHAGFGHGAMRIFARDGALMATASQSVIVRDHRDREE